MCLAWVGIAVADLPTSATLSAGGKIIYAKLEILREMFLLLHLDEARHAIVATVDALGEGAPSLASGLRVKVAVVTAANESGKAVTLWPTLDGDPYRALAFLCHFYLAFGLLFIWRWMGDIYG